MSNAGENGTLGIKLANGKELETGNPEEVYWFHKTNGMSIVQPKKKRKGGKSKGARGRGRKTVHRTKDLRTDE